jgi:hypothetical protein
VYSAAQQSSSSIGMNGWEGGGAHLPGRGHAEHDAANDIALVARGNPLEERLVVALLYLFG